MPGPKKYVFEIGGGCTPIPRKPAWVREGGRLKGFDPQAQKIILCSMHQTQNYFLSNPPKTRSSKKKSFKLKLVCVCNDEHCTRSERHSRQPITIQSPSEPQHWHTIMRMCVGAVARSGIEW
jgi:hypothetical protein